MTEYKISLYYDEPLPVFVKNAMVQTLEMYKKQGIINGYEVKIQTMEEQYAEYIKAEESAAGRDKRTEQGAEELHEEGEPGGSGSVNQEVRSDKPDNGKEGGGEVRDSGGTQAVPRKSDSGKGGHSGGSKGGKR